MGRVRRQSTIRLWTIDETLLSIVHSPLSHSPSFALPLRADATIMQICRQNYMQNCTMKKCVPTSKSSKTSPTSKTWPKLRAAKKCGRGCEWQAVSGSKSSHQPPATRHQETLAPWGENRWFPMKAVPWATLVRTMGSPSVMFTARCIPNSLSAI
jgi:hypothetical protein